MSNVNATGGSDLAQNAAPIGPQVTTAAAPAPAADANAKTAADSAGGVTTPPAIVPVLGQCQHQEDDAGIDEALKPFARQLLGLGIDVFHARLEGSVHGDGTVWVQFPDSVVAGLFLTVVARAAQDHPDNFDLRLRLRGQGSGDRPNWECRLVADELVAATGPTGQMGPVEVVVTASIRFPQGDLHFVRQALDEVIAIENAKCKEVEFYDSHIVKMKRDYVWADRRFEEQTAPFRSPGYREGAQVLYAPTPPELRKLFAHHHRMLEGSSPDGEIAPWGSNDYAMLRSTVLNELSAVNSWVNWMWGIRTGHDPQIDWRS